MNNICCKSNNSIQHVLKYRKHTLFSQPLWPHPTGFPMLPYAPHSPGRLFPVCPPNDVSHQISSLHFCSSPPSPGPRNVCELAPIRSLAIWISSFDNQLPFSTDAALLHALSLIAKPLRSEKQPHPISHLTQCIPIAQIRWSLRR